MLGEWFKRTGKRNEIFLATKFGIQMQDGKHSINSSAAYCKDACESSLKKLGVGSIDLCMFYRSEWCQEAYEAQSTLIDSIQRHLLRRQCELWQSCRRELLGMLLIAHV